MIEIDNRGLEIITEKVGVINIYRKSTAVDLCWSLGELIGPKAGQV